MPKSKKVVVSCNLENVFLLLFFILLKPTESPKLVITPNLPLKCINLCFYFIIFIKTIVCIKKRQEIFFVVYKICNRLVYNTLCISLIVRSYVSYCMGHVRVLRLWFGYAVRVYQIHFLKFFNVLLFYFK